MIAPIVIPGLSPEDQATLDELRELLAAKSYVNERRIRYFDAKQRVRHLGISIPPQLESLNTVIEWPATAVEYLENRIDLDGFAVPGGNGADLGLDVIWADNHLGVESTQAHTGALKFGTAFLAVMGGQVGEPAVVVRHLSASCSTVLWDANRRRAAAALTITSHENGSPSELILLLADKIVTAERVQGRWNIVSSVEHGLGRCPVAVLPFKPSTEAPLGRSRITQGVMSVTDRAVRTLLRMEISAEFYSSPQRYVLGADESAFVGADGQPKTGWEVTLGKMLALGLNDEDKAPSVGQFQQMTMQPHVDMVRSDAAIFSGMTKIPVGALGIIHDNPASNEAMETTYVPLNKEAERAHDSFGAGWVDAMQMAVMVRDGLTEIPDELRLLRPKWRDPAKMTKAAAAQAVMMQITSGVLPADSEVALEQLGYDDVTIQRIVSDRRRSQAGDRLSQLVAAAQQANAPKAEPAPAAVV